MIYNLLRSYVSDLENFFYKIFFKSSIKKIRDLKDKLKGGDILLVANGPSLNKTNLDRLSHIPSIGMNKINLIFNKVSWRPDYIVCGNWLVAKQNIDFFKNTNIPIFLSTKTLLSGKIARNQSYFYQKRAFSISNNCENFFGSGGTVTFIALQLARYMGAKRIFIVGMDHSFHKKTNLINKPIVEKFQGIDNNHFDPNYFKDMKWALPNLDFSEKSYAEFNSLAISEGIEIFDATINGKCKIFKKIDIKKLYNL